MRSARHALKAMGFALVMSASMAAAQDNPLQDGPTWDDLKEQVLNGALPVSDDALFALNAPFRADDPAFVPLHLTQGAGSAPIEALTLIIDENPAPVAAEF
ncbi:MAG: thiosulfate oxidation carrier protein SoxY, partial [Paracoccaceae bacterium]|nr:thiosulfate oxidation carrier protein SoxY [Paracoccaceae bacterium]